MKKPIHFVGAGPGDPELITVKGKNLLAQADRVIYAGSLVPQVLLQYCRNDVAAFNSASLTLSETHALLKEGYLRGERVVRLHTGDPALYGAIQEQMHLLDQEGIPYYVVPGVSAAFAAAAVLKQELTVPEISQTVILTRIAGKTAVPEKERLSSLAAHQATLVIYLSVQKIDEVVAQLDTHYPPETPVVVAHRIGWPDEVIIASTLGRVAQEVKAAQITRQALIMVGEVFGVRSGRTMKRSKLYNESFSHGFRKS